MNRKHILIVLILSLTLRLIALVLANPFNIAEYDSRFNIADAKNYLNLASNIYNHSEYSLSTSEPFIPDNLITPVYPGFLYIIFLLSGGPNFIYPIIFQIILSVLLAFAMMKIGYKISNYFKINNPYIPLYCGLLFALEPLFICLNMITLTESLFISILVLTVLYFVNIMTDPDKTLNWAVFGILLGLGILTRPAFIPALPVFMIIFLWAAYREKKLKAILLRIFLSSVILITVISPWIIRNKITYNEWGLTTIGPYSVYVMHIALLESKKRNISEQDAADSLIKHISIPKTGMTFEVSDRISKEVFNYFINNPVPFMKYWMISCVKTLFQPGTQHIVRLVGIESYQENEGINKPEDKNVFFILVNYVKDSFYLIFYWIYYVIYATLFFTSLLYFFFTKNKYKTDPLIVCLYVSAFILLVFSSLVQSARYRLPAIILLIPISSIFMHKIILIIFNKIKFLKIKLKP